VHRNVTALDLSGKPVEPVAPLVRVRVTRTADIAPVEVRRLDERVRALALDLAGGDISRVVIEDDGTVTVVNASRRR
jgi:hypothetical protein